MVKEGLQLVMSELDTQGSIANVLLLMLGFTDLSHPNQHNCPRFATPGESCESSYDMTMLEYSRNANMCFIQNKTVL